MFEVEIGLLIIIELLLFVLLWLLNRTPKTTSYTENLYKKICQEKKKECPQVYIDINGKTKIKINDNIFDI